MLAELVKTTTSDGLLLAGALCQPRSECAPSIAVDAVVCLHGVGGNFYTSELFDQLTQTLTDMGISVLRVNTRGHDSMNMTKTLGGSSRQGAAYEVVDQCRYDVAAWVDYLVTRGYQRIGLIGHSLGAIKGVYAEAYQPHSATCFVMAFSPPRLSYAAFENSESSAAHHAAISTASEQIDAGRPEALIQVRFPFPLLISAAAYVDKYGPGERYNILQFTHRVARPLLFTYGELELETGGVAFAGMPHALRGSAAAGQQLDIVTVAGADHMYNGRHAELSVVVGEWLRKNLPA